MCAKLNRRPSPKVNMCGVWVALEDIHPDSGPLVVFPGSHRFDSIFAADVGIERMNPWTDAHLSEQVRQKWEPPIRQLVANSGPQKLCTMRADTALVWHANLLHAGSTRINPGLTRKSTVSHYYARGACVFSDAPGCGSARVLLEDAIALGKLP